jgi:hypothetical protein
MVQILEIFVVIFELIQFQLNLTSLMLEFFNLVEPFLSSLAIISGFLLYLHEKFVKNTSVQLQENVTSILVSEILEGRKKN